VRILREHGFKVRATLSRTAAERRSRRHHFVAAEDVDRAVAVHMTRETPEEAARRLGICADRLRARLAAMGVQNAPGTRKRLLVTDAQVEAANGIAVWSHRNRAARASTGEG
jgi:hypothetical protein